MSTAPARRSPETTKASRGTIEPYRAQLPAFVLGRDVVFDEERYAVEWTTQVAGFPLIVEGLSNAQSVWVHLQHRTSTLSQLGLLGKIKIRIKYLMDSAT
ncbi:MAG: hypothetical protein LQ352_008042 [Teloschistes flavicans]|nr:MAG: hypothetical protein LQ352_008042 [Teloschistes flavicans]